MYIYLAALHREGISDSKAELEIFKQSGTVQSMFDWVFWLEQEDPPYGWFWTIQRIGDLPTVQPLEEYDEVDEYEAFSSSDVSSEVEELVKRQQDLLKRIVGMVRIGKLDRGATLYELDIYLDKYGAVELPKGPEGILRWTRAAIVELQKGGFISTTLDVDALMEWTTGAAFEWDEIWKRDTEGKGWDPKEFSKMPTREMCRWYLDENAD